MKRGPNLFGVCGASLVAGLAVAVSMLTPVGALLRLPASLDSPAHALLATRATAPASRLFVMAVHDSRQLTLCPAADWPASKPGVLPDVDGVVVLRRQRLTIHVRQTDEEATQLPLPPDDSSKTGTDLDDGMVSMDEEVRKAIAKEVNRLQAFSIVESPEQADYVLFVEAVHGVEAAFTGVTPDARGSAAIVQSGGDREVNFREALFGVLVPAQQYSRIGPNGPALLSASQWTGLALARSAGARGVLRREPASVERLVRQLADRSPRPPRFPVLCGAQPHTAGRQETPRQSAAPVTGGELAGPTSPVPVPSPVNFRGGITYVSLPVVVTEEQGRPVRDLTASDFRIFEDNVPQSIERFLATEAAANLVLLVDTSSSMRLERGQLQSATRGFIESLRQDDQVMLVTFDDRLRAQTGFTSDHAQLHRAVQEMNKGTGTRLYDALSLIPGRAIRVVPDRSAIVLLTDGVDTRSRLADANGAVAAIEESRIPVYVIQYDTRREDYSLPYGNRSLGMSIRDMKPELLPEGAEDNSALFKRADDFLASLVDASGGRLYRAEGLPRLNDALVRIMAELRNQYTVGFYPANQLRDGKSRVLRVEVNRPNVSVKTRKSYRALSGAVAR
jgi:Ca-activated chloride channel homolog